MVLLSCVQSLVCPLTSLMIYSLRRHVVVLTFYDIGTLCRNSRSVSSRIAPITNIHVRSDFLYSCQSSTCSFEPPSIIDAIHSLCTITAAIGSTLWSRIQIDVERDFYKFMNGETRMGESPYPCPISDGCRRFYR